MIQHSTFNTQHCAKALNIQHFFADKKIGVCDNNKKRKVYRAKRWRKVWQKRRKNVYLQALIITNNL